MKPRPIETLPAEVFLTIFDFIPVSEIGALAEVCRGFRELLLPRVYTTRVLRYGESGLHLVPNPRALAFVRCITLSPSRSQWKERRSVGTGSEAASSLEEKETVIYNVGMEPLPGIIQKDRIREISIHGSSPLAQYYTCTLLSSAQKFLSVLSLSITETLVRSLDDQELLSGISSLRTFKAVVYWPTDGSPFRPFDIQSIWTLVNRNKATIRHLSVQLCQQDHPARNLPDEMGISSQVYPGWEQEIFSEFETNPSLPNIRKMFRMGPKSPISAPLALTTLELGYVIQLAKAKAYATDCLFIPEKLRSLSLTDCPLSGGFLRHYASRLTNLKELRISKSPAIWFFLTPLLFVLPPLEVLYVTGWNDCILEQRYLERHKATLRVFWMECTVGLGELHRFNCDYSDWSVLEELAVARSNHYIGTLRLPPTLKTIRILQLPSFKRRQARKSIQITLDLARGHAIRWIKQQEIFSDANANLETVAFGTSWCEKHRSDHPRVYKICRLGGNEYEETALELDEITEEELHCNRKKVQILEAIPRVDGCRHDEV